MLCVLFVAIALRAVQLHLEPRRVSDSSVVQIKFLIFATTWLWATPPCRMELWETPGVPAQVLGCLRDLLVPSSESEVSYAARALVFKLFEAFASRGASMRNRYIP